MAVIKNDNDNYQPTHKALVRRMGQYFKSVKNATVVMAELSTAAGETPDVIAWFGGATSVLIEVKVSRADFLSDKDKLFRRQEDYGMGDIRYYAAPKGLIKPSELPEGWGLFDVTERRVYESVKPIGKESNKTKECMMLMSALRRLEISTAVFVRQDTEIDIQEGSK